MGKRFTPKRPRHHRTVAGKKKEMAAAVTEPKEVTDMSKLIIGFQSAIQSGRMSHILSTKKNFANPGDWFTYTDEAGNEQRFIFIAGPKSVTLQFAADVLWHVLGYMSREDFKRGTSMIMDGWKASKKMFLFAFVPSIECVSGVRGSIHQCKYLPEDLSIYRTEDGAYMLHHSGYDEEADYTIDAAMPIYNCPGCRAVLTAVLE